MTFQSLQDLFAKFTQTEDTTDPPISTTDRDALINEAYLEYIAKFLGLFVYTADYSSAANLFTVGLSTEGQWIECETGERKSGSVYIPLKRGSFGELLGLAASEGATGPPEQYALSLRSRAMSSTDAGTSVFVCAVYPVPDQSYSYRFRIKTWPQDLTNGASSVTTLVLDEVDGDRVARIAALRAGLVLGYGLEWFDEASKPLPEQVRATLEIDDLTRWPYKAPRRIAEAQSDGRL